MSVGGRTGVRLAVVATESAALVGAIALAALVVTRVVASARGALLFSDGDSMLPAIFVHSLQGGHHPDWAMSSVLFIPELAVFGAIWRLGFGLNWAITVNAIVNLAALYVALRCIPGRWFRSRVGILGASAAFVAFAGLAMLDRSASRDSLELSSLLTTATYYSATVIALVVTLGLVRKSLSRPVRPAIWECLIALVAAGSVMSNPLYLLWATAPIGTILLVLWAITRRGTFWRPAVVLVGASILGYLLRLPLAAHIANDGLGYIDITAVGSSAAYYAALVVAMFSTLTGALSVLGVVVLIGLSVVLTRRAWGRRNLPDLVVAIAGWAIPALVVVAAVALGTHAARYLQPVVFAPLAAVSLMPRLVRLPRLIAGRSAMAATGAAAVLIVSACVVAPTLVSTVARPDRDLECVTDWVNRSGRTGAGQYWSVRLPKAHIANSRQLVQVDALLQPYNWLVDRTDASVNRISFLIADANSTPYELSGSPIPKVISCGRYQIWDFGSRTLPLGAPHS